MNVGNLPGFGVTEESEMDLWMHKFAHNVTETFESQLKVEANPNYQRTTLFGFTDISPFLRSAIGSLVSDSFTQCFEVRGVSR
jgi:hypothetical protein